MILLNMYTLYTCVIPKDDINSSLKVIESIDRGDNRIRWHE